MARYSGKRYNLHVLLLMVVYVAVMLWLWPLAQTTGNVWLKVVLSISPAVPVAAVVALMARRVMTSDELQQRLHLLALGITTAVVGTLCLIGGLLAMSKVWTTSGDVVFWVFPALCVGYGLARTGLARWYNGSWDCQ